MPTIDRMTPEGQRLMAELEKLNKLAAYVASRVERRPRNGMGMQS